MSHQPLHSLSQPGSTARLKPDDSTSSLAPAILRRLADPGQGAPAALAFLTVQAAQRGPGWAQEAFPALLDWLTEPHVTATQPFNPQQHHSLQPPEVSLDARLEAVSHGSRGRGLGSGGGGGYAQHRPACLGGWDPQGLWLTPRALGFPRHLQPQLRQLLAALTRCPKLYGSLDDRRRTALQQLLESLPRGFSGSRPGGASGAVIGSAAATGATARGLTGERGVGGGARAGGVAGMPSAWVQAALQASRLRYQRQSPPHQRPLQQQQQQAWRGRSRDAAAKTAAATGPEPAAAAVPEARLPWVGADTGDHDDDGGGGRGGEKDGGDGGWWWIPEALSARPQADLGSGQGDGQDPDSGPAAAVPAPSTPGEVGAAGRRRRQPSPARRAEAGEEEEEEACRAAGDDQDGATRRLEEGARAGHGLGSPPPRPSRAGAASSPPAKRPRTVEAAAEAVPLVSEALSTAAVAASGDDGGGGGGSAAPHPASLSDLLAALQDAIGGGGDDDDAGGGGGVPAATPETWRRLEELLERCAANGLPYSGGIDGVATGAAPPPALPADAVQLIVRQLVTPRLSGAAARLLLGSAVLPAVAAVERVMPRPLQEAMAAAAGPHPRPLTEAVLVPAVQRPQLSAGGAQLLVKATTTGPHALPRPLQALVLRSACAAAGDWGEPHLAVVQGLVEAGAKEGLDQETLGFLCQGLCVAARTQQHTQQQHKTAAGVPLCRLLLSLLSKHGAGLAAPQLRQLQEAASATSTFLTKPCLAKVQELLAPFGG